MVAAGLDRRLTVIWNAVPWWNGTRKISSAELADGIEVLRQLFLLLPELRVVMLVGKKAGRAKPLLERENLQVFTSAHPSPVVRASRRAVWDGILPRTGTRFALPWQLDACCSAFTP